MVGVTVSITYTMNTNENQGDEACTLTASIDAIY